MKPKPITRRKVFRGWISDGSYPPEELFYSWSREKTISHVMKAKITVEWQEPVAVGRKVKL